MYHKKNGTILPRILSVILAAGLTLSSAVTYVGAAETDTSTSTAVEQENETAQEEHESAPAEEKEAPAEEQKSEGEGETDQSSEQDSEGEQDSEENHGADEEHVESPDTESDQQSGDDQKEAVEEQEDSGEEQAPEGEQNAEGEQDSEDGTTVQEGVETNPSDTTEDGTGDQAAAGEESEKKDEASESAVEGEETDAAADSTDAVNSGETTADVIEEPSEIQDIPGAVRMMEDSQAKNGWVDDEDGRRYYQNNEYVRDKVIEIDGNFYGFNYDGLMYDEEEEFGAYDDAGEWHFYRAKQDGSVYRNEWYESYGGWLYYDNKGHQLTGGKATIHGNDYYFYDGWMVESAYVNTEDGLYFANKSGALSKAKDGTYYHGTNFNMVIVKNGITVKNQWITLDGDWYHFDDRGNADTGSTQIGDYLYYFDNDGVMQSNGWIFDSDDEYYRSVMYAESAGRLKIGQQYINGKWYYFDDNGYLMTGVVEYNGHKYLCGKDGAYIKTVPQNGWDQNNGTWYYWENGEYLSDTEKTIGDYTYYFDYDGVMIKNRALMSNVYDAYGHKIKQGWYLLNGSWYYIDPDTTEYVTGEKNIGGKEYYFDYDGIMQTGEIEIDGELRVYGQQGNLISRQSIDKLNGWKLFGGRYYYYKNGSPYTGWVGNYYVEGGRMLTDAVRDGYYVNDKGVWVNKQGWISRNHGDSYYYIKQNGRVADDEWVLVNGSWYYFDGYWMVNDCIQKISGKNYLFAPSGRLLYTVDPSKTESKWILADGCWYYIQNGEFVRDTAITVNGKNYIFDYEGRMCKNEIAYSNSKHDYMYVGADGVVCNYTGWKKLNGKWYWFKKNHTVKEGWLNIGGKVYYFGYNEKGMVTGDQVIAGKLHHFDSSGALTSVKSPENEWILAGGEWYYFRNGYPVEGIYTINNTAYGFDYYGEMIRNDIVYSDGYEYYVDANGKVSFSSGWRKIDGRWYYFGTGGRRLRGLQMINGKMYNLDTYY